MCRRITKEQQLEGWRAVAGLVSGMASGLVSGLGPIRAGVLAAVMARLGRKADPGRGALNAIS